MMYINYEKILSPVEIESLSTITISLVEFLREVPLRESHNSKVEKKDISIDVLPENHLFEIYALIKRIFKRRKESGGAFDVLWKQFIKNPEEATLDDFIAYAMAVEPFAANIEYTITGSFPKGKVFNSFFENFRSINPQQPSRHLSIFPKEAGPLNTLIRNVKGIRNMVGHGHGNLPLRSGRLMIMGAIVAIVGRFFPELRNKILNNNDYDSFKMEEIVSSETLQMWLCDFVREYRSTCVCNAEERIVNSFSGTPLGYIKNPWDKIPSLSSSLDLNFNPGTILLVGRKGSGKSVFLNQKIINGGLTPTVIYSDTEVRFPKNLSIPDMIVTMMMGDAIHLTSPRKIETLRQWILREQKEGGITLIFDRNNLKEEWISHIYNHLFNTLSGLKIILTVDTSEQLNSDIVKESQFVSLSGLTIEGREKLSRLIAEIRFPEFDVSHVLLEKISKFSDITDLSHPQTFISIIVYLTDKLNKTDINIPALVSALREDLSPEDPLVLTNLKEMDSIEALASEVRDDLYSGGGATEAIERIKKSDWFADDDRIRLLFRYCEEMKNSENIAILATLSARAILYNTSDEEVPDHKKHYPNSNLVTLGRLTAGLPIPNKTHTNSNGVIYRPSPRRIVRDMTVNLLRLYSISKRPDASREEITIILRAAAAIGTTLILDLLFSSGWAHRWLDSDLFLTTIVFVSNPIALIRKALEYYANLSIYGEDLRNHNLIALFTRLLKKMNDFQRIIVIQYLKRSEDRFRYTGVRRGELINIAIMTMDIPTAVELYDTDAEYLFHSVWKSISSKIGNSRYEELLLFKIARHAVNKRLIPVLSDVLEKILYYQFFDNPLFESLINAIADSPKLYDALLDKLKRIPLDKLTEENRLKIFNPTLTDLTLNNSNLERNRKVCSHIPSRPTLTGDSRLALVVPGYRELKEANYIKIEGFPFLFKVVNEFPLLFPDFRLRQLLSDSLKEDNLYDPLFITLYDKEKNLISIRYGVITPLVEAACCRRAICKETAKFLVEEVSVEPRLYPIVKKILELNNYTSLANKL